MCMSPIFVYRILSIYLMKKGANSRLVSLLFNLDSRTWMCVELKRFKKEKGGRRDSI